MQKTRTPQTIRNALIKMQTLSGGLVLLFACIIFFTKELYQFKGQVLDESESIAHIISRNIAPSLEFDDKKEAYKILKSLEGNKFIASVEVYDKSKKLYIAFGEIPNPNNVLTLPSSNFQNDENSFSQLIYLKKIQEGKNLLGYLLLRFNKRHFRDTLLFYLLAFLLTLFISSLIGLSLAHYMQQKISLPIQSLITTITNIKENNFTLNKIAAPHEIENIHEFQILYANFIEMIQGISNRQDIINSTNKNLELIVKKRTLELDNERAKTIHDSKLKALGVLAGGVAHEINNPLSIINLNTSLLRRLIISHNITDPKFEKITDDIAKTVNKISAIIKALKNISRDSSNDQLEEVNIEKLIDEVVDLASINFNLSVIKIEKISTLNPHQIVSCRQGQIQQVILNLLNNAIDEVLKTENPWIKIGINKKAENLEIIISDSGPGVALENREKIFDPFFTTKDIGKGTGLGLSISKKIIQQHGGDLYIGKGSCSQFILTFPFSLKNDDLRPS